MNDNGKITMADYTVSMSPVQRGDPASSCIGCGESKVKETMGK